MTSFTVLVVTLILFIYGGEVIHDFAFALLVDLLQGVYSSIYIAAPILIFWKEKRSSRLLKKPSTALITQIRKNDYNRYFKEF